MSYCRKCGNQLKVGSNFCDKCGESVTSTGVTNNQPYKTESDTVKISFPVWRGQMFNNNCYVYDSDGNIIVSCKQGETVEFSCTFPMNISVKMQNCFGNPKHTVNPGDNFKVDFRGFGKIYIAKVDHIL